MHINHQNSMSAFRNNNKSCCYIYRPRTKCLNLSKFCRYINTQRVHKAESSLMLKCATCNIVHCIAVLRWSRLTCPITASVHQIPPWMAACLPRKPLWQHTLAAVPRWTQPSTLQGTIKWVSAYGDAEDNSSRRLDWLPKSTGLSLLTFIR